MGKLQTRGGERERSKEAISRRGRADAEKLGQTNRMRRRPCGGSSFQLPASLRNLTVSCERAWASWPFSDPVRCAMCN